MLLDWNNLKTSSDACWSTLCLSEKLYYDVLDDDNDLDYVDVSVLELLIGICQGSMQLSRP